MGRLMAANRRNGFLLERSLAHVRGALSLLSTLITQSSTYEPSGRPAPAGSPLQILDQRI